MPLPIRSSLLVSALLAALVALPAAAVAAETLRITDPVTDNYKASYNADPSATELRTWLAIKSVSAAGTIWRPQGGGSIAVTDGPLTLVAADGRTASLTARIASGPATSLLSRVDPIESDSRGRWGSLLALTGRDALRSTPVTVALTLGSGGSILATGVVQYRHDPAIAGVASDHIEYNGPGGRWFVGGVATRTEWAPAPATAPTLVAGIPPRITSVRVPASTTRRTIDMRVTGRAGSARITLLRVSIAGRAFSRWVRIAPRYSIVLPAGTATRLVRVQLRDANGLASGVVSRRVRCSCG